MAREGPVSCPHCTRGLSVDLLQHTPVYGGKVHDEAHLELALTRGREEKAAKSTIVAQFTEKVSDDNGRR